MTLKQCESFQGVKVQPLSKCSLFFVVWFWISIKRLDMLTGLMKAELQKCLPFKRLLYCNVSLPVSLSLLMDHHPSDRGDFCTVASSGEVPGHDPTSTHWLPVYVCVCICVVGMTKRFVKASVSTPASSSLSDVWLLSCRACVLQRLTYPDNLTHLQVHQYNVTHL